MFYAVKFETLEARSSFANFANSIGWSFYDLNGSNNLWALETAKTKTDYENVEYLHSLGAFKFENEKA